MNFPTFRFFFIGKLKAFFDTHVVLPNVGRMSSVAMVVEAVLDGSEYRGPNEVDLRDFEERDDGSGCLVCVALLWALLLAGWCSSGAKVIQRHQWRWRGSSRSLRLVWASVWGKGCLSKGGTDAEGSRRRRQGDRRVRNRQMKRVEVKWDPQERVEEPTAEPLPGFTEYCVTTAAEAVASTVVESVDGCEVRPETESKGHVSEYGLWHETESERSVSAWRWQENEHERCVSA